MHWSILGVAFVALSTSVASSQEFARYSRIVDRLSLSEPRASVANIASGFGSKAGDIYASVSYSDFDLQTKVEGDDDGSMMFGMGLGDPEMSVGGELTVAITSVSTGLWGDGKFADEGNLSVKLHKIVPSLLNAQHASISFGASNVVGWGSTTDNPVNYYVSYSAQDRFGEFNEYAYAYTIGYGTAVSALETQGDLFFGASFGYDSVSASIANIGSETHVSGTYFPPKLPGSSVTITRADAFDSNDSKRFILSIGYSFSLREM